MFPIPYNQFPFTWVGFSGLSDSYSTSPQKHSGTHCHSHTFMCTSQLTNTHPSLGHCGLFWWGSLCNSVRLLKRWGAFINYISYIPWNIIFSLNNCRRQLWYFDSLPRTNVLLSLACWADLSWWKTNVFCSFHSIFVLENDEMLPWLNIKHGLQPLCRLWKENAREIDPFYLFKQ